EYRQLCKALDKGYGFERMLPEEGYDPVYGSFICVLVTTAARKQGILMARSYNTLFGAFLPDCTLLHLENVPCQQIPLDMPKRPVREAVRGQPNASGSTRSPCGSTTRSCATSTGNRI